MNASEYVDAAVSANGGKRNSGGMILELTDVLLEAQFHAVWVKPNGLLLDVTPQDERRILFLPDTKARFTRQRTPSRHEQLSDAREVASFIEACAELWRFEDSHWFDDGIAVLK